jgi:hypothetical protein
MNAVKAHVVRAHVVNGQVVVDEPTPLPEGAELEVRVISESDEDADDAALEASLERALDDEDAGRMVDAAEVLNRLRARRANQAP